MSESCVYIQDETHGWLPAHVLEQAASATCATDTVDVRVLDVDQSTVLQERHTVSLQNYANKSLPLQNVDASGMFMEMEDMVDLPSLHEAAIVYNLRARHLNCKPYTRVGDLIVAVNPFQWREALYTDQVRSLYVDRLVFRNATSTSTTSSSSSSSTDNASLPPHVYETSAMAYRGLAVDQQDQSILASGESGAGKTETVKIVMSHLASVNSPTLLTQEGTMPASSSNSTHHLVVQRVLDSHPLLEAFGNAKTVRNDNSSRFGKYIQLQFHVEDASRAAYAGRAVPHCRLAGSKCTTYLLEKSRVVSHEVNERTYHIFYQLLAAPNATKVKFWKGLQDTTLDSFSYLVAGNVTRDDCDSTVSGAAAAAAATADATTIMIEGQTDAQRWERTLQALETLNVKGDRLSTLMRAVCVVLQLGNLTFAPNPNNDEESIITSRNELTALAELMGVPQDVMEKALLYRTVSAARESYTVPLKVERARDGCDALAKEVYQQAFDWLVRQVNLVTSAEENYDDSADVEEYGMIGLLDIFGFESFETNRFEQLCINYTNEKLQQKYTIDIFCSVQEEYEQEGIELGEITFDDNAQVLHLIEGRVGIISVLNEECVRPNGNDVGFVSKIKSVNSEAVHLVSEKLHAPTEFAIEHYAGQVTYDATNFVQKNTDTLPKDVVDFACLSSNEIIQVEIKGAADSKMSVSGDGQANLNPKRRGASNHTVTSKFKHQLSHLMHAISTTKTRYIRCIKPNPEREPLKMNMKTSAEQLRCAGVVAAVTISRVAFPSRLMHETVLERFGCLGQQVTLGQVGDEKKDDIDDACIRLRESVASLLESLLKGLETKSEDGVATKAFEIGNSRVYFRTRALESLEAKRLVALGRFATTIECIVRGFTARSVFWKLKYTAIDSQANARRTIVREAFLEKKRACIVIECWTRCIFAKRELTRLYRDAASVKLQSKWRSTRAALVLNNCKAASVLIQKTARGAIQRPKYVIALKEAEEEARVNTKLAALHRRLQEAEMKWIQADKQRIEAEKRADGLVGSPETRAAPVTPATRPDSIQEEKKVERDSPENQKALIDESNELLEYFRQEVFKLKSANYLLRTDLVSLRESNHHLMDHNRSLEASHSALKQNVAKMSQSNMRLAVSHSEQKDTIAKLKQELKMEKIRTTSEKRALLDQLKDKDEMHEAELNRMRREIEQLRKITAKTPNRGSQKYERARTPHRNEKGISLPRVVSQDNISVTSTAASSEEEWGHDAFMERTKTQQQYKQENSTYGKRRDRRPRKPRPPPSANRRYSGGGPRGSNSSSNKGPPTETGTIKSSAKKPMPNSSLAAAAARITPTPSPSNSRPSSRAASPAGNRSAGPRGSTSSNNSVVVCQVVANRASNRLLRQPTIILRNALCRKTALAIAATRAGIPATTQTRRRPYLVRRVKETCRQGPIRNLRYVITS